MTREWVNESQRRIGMQLGAGADAAPLKAPRTRIIDRLVKVLATSPNDYQLSGITAYHLTNSGQGPDIRIYTLPSLVVRFVQLARLPDYRTAWNAIAARSWRRVNKEVDASDLTSEDRGDLTNSVYDDLFTLPEGAERFLRRHVLRLAIARMEARKRGGDHVAEQLPLWRLTTLFLTEVVGMDKPRIDAIRILADALAEDIAGTNDRQLFYRAYRARRFLDVRKLLLSEGFQRLKREDPPLLSLDSFLTIFEEGEEVARSDWQLAWDLVLIRLLEQLYPTSFFGKNKDVVENAAAELESQAEVAEE
jgi:CRISPR-associated protein Cst1